MEQDIRLFELLVLSISNATLIALGEVEGGDCQAVDLYSAMGHIDSLRMLRDKTKGNLIKTEQDILERVIYDLQLKLVEVRKNKV